MHLEINQATDRTERVANSVVAKLYNLAYTDGIQESQLDSLSTVVGSISVAATYDAYITYLTTRFPNLHITADSTYIKFFDSTFEQILLQNNIGDGTGITSQDTAQVSSVTNLFNTSTTVNFKDLQYLTKYGLTVTYIYNFSASQLDNLGIAEGTWSNGNIFNTVDVVFPKNGSVYFQDVMFGTPNTKRLIGINSINWNGCTISTNIGRAWYQNQVFKGCYFSNPSSQIIPPMSDFSNMRLFNFCVINKVIIPEGVVSITENFDGCDTNYIEYPSTITNIGALFTDFRRGANSTNAGTGCIVIKAVTPPTATSPNSNHKYPAHIYVPDGSVTAYLSASGGWTDSTIQSLITPMSQMSAGELELGTVTQEDINRT